MNQPIEKHDVILNSLKNTLETNLSKLDFTFEYKKDLEQNTSERIQVGAYFRLMDLLKETSIQSTKALEIKRKAERKSFVDVLSKYIDKTVFLNGKPSKIDKLFIDQVKDDLLVFLDKLDYIEVDKNNHLEEEEFFDDINKDFDEKMHNHALLSMVLSVETRGYSYYPNITVNSLHEQIDIDLNIHHNGSNLIMANTSISKLSDAFTDIMESSFDVNLKETSSKKPKKTTFSQ